MLLAEESNPSREAGVLYHWYVLPHPPRTDMKLEETEHVSGAASK